MTAPSDVHELRVHVLTTMAELAGLDPLHGCFAAGLRPDVLACDHHLRRLLVGEAKATESPGCAATRARLIHYVDAVRVYLGKGFATRLAVCHPPAASDWGRALAVACRATRIACSKSASTVVGEHVVTWTDITPDLRERPSIAA